MQIVAICCPCCCYFYTCVHCPPLPKLLPSPFQLPPASVRMLMFALDEFKFSVTSPSEDPSSYSGCNYGTHNQMQPPLSVRFDAIDKDNGKFISLIEFLRRKFYVYVMISSSSFHILSHARTWTPCCRWWLRWLVHSVSISPPPPQGRLCHPFSVGFRLVR